MVADLAYKKADWHFIVIFSNTEHAHTLDRIYNWVVISFSDSHYQEGEYTVVIDTRGYLNNLCAV